MRTRTKLIGLFLICLPVFVGSIASAGTGTATLTVGVDKPGVRISPMLYGLMTEEINHAYDGGLYAELIQNRAFLDNKEKPIHWSLMTTGSGKGEINIDSTDPVNATGLPKSLRLDIASADANAKVGVANDGYWGIPVKPNTHYTASFYARGKGLAGPLTVAIESNDGATTYATGTTLSVTDQWQQITVPLTTAGDVTPTADARFVISANSPGSLYLSLVSLFPPTFNDRPNGSRIDLMEKMGAMHPSFLRFPGGNYLEGDTIATRFDWKKTLHGIETRPGHMGCWSYRSSDGFGLYEFLTWVEDLHMKPVLAVYAGYSLRGEHVGAGPMLQPFIDDALDEIEYVSGAADTKWGAERAKAGHPEPFDLTYVEIGNEDGFDHSGSYDGRYAQFYDAIKAKYPKLQLIATAGVKSRRPDVIDDHFYRSTGQMASDSKHYDKTDRNGPKIFVGEWASMEGKPTPNFTGALGDAAWMTGLERNSDVVVMSCYVPLLVDVNPKGWQWPTNLIGFNALSSFGSPSYYVQTMFGQNRGDVVLPVTADVKITPGEEPMPRGGIGVGAWRTQAEFKDIKVTAADGATLYASDFSNATPGWKFGHGKWKAVDGALQQSGDAPECTATAGDVNWTDYTMTLKARKTAGSEGFLVLVHAIDQHNWVWCNIGGWGNTRAGFESSSDAGRGEIGSGTQFTVDTGKWYDVRVEAKGRGVKCFVDDKLVAQADDTTPAKLQPVYSTASRDDATGDVIVKVVNIGPDDLDTTVQLTGVTAVAAGAKSITLTADSPTAQNTIEEPTKVAPKEEPINDAGPSFHHTFPAKSITVVRLKPAT